MTWWEDWFRRRRRRFPFFEDIDKMIEDMFKDFFEDLPKELFREEKLPDGSTVRKYGPFVYGYSMTMGPDGKPVIREFGNMRPSRMGVPKPAERREPLVDVITGDKVIQVLAELPGVEKSDINLNVSEDSLTISVDTETRKYHKEVGLPEKVDPDSAKANYKNGVLEVTLNKREERKPPGKRITIE
ncbi:MAG: archaeal heat shock protein Hsp20 [Candidatus Geothermarchaeales archaeon]